MSWISLIALAGWLILAIGAYRSRQIDARRTLIMALAWASVFLLVTVGFLAIGR